MNKKIVMLLMFLVSSIMAFGKELPQFSWSQETSLIERYIKNYRSAIKDYNKLIYGQLSGGSVAVEDEQGRQSQRAMTPAEKNALLDAIEAKRAASLLWGFKWLAAYWVENLIGFDTQFGMNDCSDVVKPVVEDHLAAMIGKKRDAGMPEITTFIDSHALETVIINTYFDLNNQKHRAARDDRNFDDVLNPQEIKDRCKETYENLTEDNIISIVSSARDCHKVPFDSPHLNLYRHSMRLNKQKYKNYKLDEVNMDDRYNSCKYYFCKHFLPMIEDRDEHIVRLKRENPVDTNAKTNEFARLFDRIAK